MRSQIFASLGSGSIGGRAKKVSERSPEPSELLRVVRCLHPVRPHERTEQQVEAVIAITTVNFADPVINGKRRSRRLRSPSRLSRVADLRRDKEFAAGAAPELRGPRRRGSGSSPEQFEVSVAGSRRFFLDSVRIFGAAQRAAIAA